MNWATSEGQDRLERAKDRLDTKDAEIGQAELDKQEDEQNVDQAQGQEDDADGNVEEADETKPTEQGTPVPSTPRDAPEPQRFDMSRRGSSPKRRVGNDNMEDDSQDKRPRPRSYHTELTLSQ